MTSNSLCDSCTNIECEFQSGIVRTKCAFYIPLYPIRQKMGRWIDDKRSVCGKGIEDLISSPEWYRNEEPNYCPFCGLKLVDSKE